MSNPITETPNEQPDASNVMERSDADRRDAAKSLLTFWNGHYWDSSRLLAQAWAFYLTITAALVGFVATKSLPEHIATGLVWAAIVVTVTHSIGATLWAWAIMRLVGTIEALHVELDATLCRDLGLERTFTRWRTVGALVASLCFLMGMIILTGLALLCGSLLSGP